VFNPEQGRPGMADGEKMPTVLAKVLAGTALVAFFNGFNT
jgi:hypothetical protein